MKLTIRQKFFVFAILILSVVSILSYASYQSSKKVFDSSKLIDHSELVVSKTDFIQSIEKDIETGSRGFIITNDSAFLKPLKEAGKIIFSYIKELKQLTKDDSGQQLRIDSLNLFIHKSLGFELKADEVRSKEGLAAASALIATKQGNQYTDAVRRICTAIKMEEARLLMLRKQSNENFVAQSNRYSFLIILLRILLTVIVLIATGSYLIKSREKEKLAAEIVQQNINKHREITEAVIAAHEAERSHIGQELHENINQLLATSKLYNDMANKASKNRSALLAASTDYTLMAIEEIRRLSKELITPLMQDIGLIKSIDLIAADIMKIHSLKIEISAENFDENILSQKFKLNLLRIVQVQISNTVKHAKASNLKINFLQTNQTLLVTISDDGIGFDTAVTNEGTGIKNIISRAGLYKGEVLVTSAPGKGFLMDIAFDNSNFLNS